MGACAAAASACGAGASCERRERIVIGRIAGKLLEKNPPQVLVDAHGVGYEIDVPMSTFYNLPELGGTVSLFTHLVVREDAHLLYGFGSENERRAFRQLLKVNGIGAKIALSVLSGASADEFARWVQTGDIAALTRIPGIGKKTAERIIVELRDRIDGIALATFGIGGSGGGPKDPVAEASVALQQLGYKPVEVARLVKDAAEAGDTAETIIRKALKAALR